MNKTNIFLYVVIVNKLEMYIKRLTQQIIMQAFEERASNTESWLTDRS